MHEQNCPICDSQGGYAFTTQHKFEVYVCANSDCRHLWLPGRKPDQGVHQRMPSLDIESNQNLRNYAKRNKRLLKILLKKIHWNNSDHLKICDFGAGCAHVSRTFKNELNHNATIYCIDGNPKVLEFYAGWGLEAIRNIQDIPDEAIDLIYAIEVIEHLDEPESILRQLRKKLKPNAKLFITTPEGRLNECETNAYDNPAHVQFFTESSLNLLLSKCGFSPLEYIDRYIMYLQPQDHTIQTHLKSILVKNLVRFKRLAKRAAFTQRNNSAIATPNSATYEGKGFRRYHIVGFTEKAT